MQVSIHYFVPSHLPVSFASLSSASMTSVKILLKRTIFASTELCRKKELFCSAPALHGRLWLAAAGQKLSLNLAPFLLLNPVQYKSVIMLSDKTRNRLQRGVVSVYVCLCVCGNCLEREIAYITDFFLVLLSAV